MAVINSSGVGARWGLRSRASASSWTDIVFRQCGLSYVAAPLTKSELYKADGDRLSQVPRFVA
jgi:hypothetical protein